MSLSGQDAALDAIAQSLAAALPSRIVGRTLVQPGAVLPEQMMAGVLCLVAQGGGQFANYMGREGDCGRMDARLVGFVQVPESQPAEDVERAELALLVDVLTWINSAPVPGIAVLPTQWTQSQQLEHPYGWVVLTLEIRL